MSLLKTEQKQLMKSYSTVLFLLFYSAISQLLSSSYVYLIALVFSDILFWRHWKKIFFINYLNNRNHLCHSSWYNKWAALCVNVGPKEHLYVNPMKSPAIHRRGKPGLPFPFLRVLSVLLSNLECHQSVYLSNLSVSCRLSAACCLSTVTLLTTKARERLPRAQVTSCRTCQS